MPDFFFTKGRQLANVFLWKEEAVMNKDSAFPSRWWVSQRIAAGCHGVLCCHKDFTHRLDNLFNKSTCIYLFFFFSPGIYLETHSHIIMHAQCLLTWHTLFIISNPMLSLGSESSLCNITRMVPCDHPCPCWGKNKKKPKKHRRVLTQRYNKYPSNRIQVTLARGVFLTSQKHLLISVGNVLAQLIQTLVSGVINGKTYFSFFESDLALKGGIPANFSSQSRALH